MATNLTGAFLTMKHAVPHLAANGGGSIVAVSSIAAVATHRYMTPYNVSKAGLEMLVRQVADELGGLGIRANAVRPSLVPTDISAGLMAVPEIVEDYLEQMPLHRTGTTEDIASLVRFLPDRRARGSRERASAPTAATTSAGVRTSTVSCGCSSATPSLRPAQPPTRRSDRVRRVGMRNRAAIV